MNVLQLFRHSHSCNGNGWRLVIDLGRINSRSQEPNVDWLRALAGAALPIVGQPGTCGTKIRVSVGRRLLAGWLRGVLFPETQPYPSMPGLPGLATAPPTYNSSRWLAGARWDDITTAKIRIHRYRELPKVPWTNNVRAGLL